MIDQPALVKLLHYLSKGGYRFVAVTPTTHARVLDRPFDGKQSLRDIFGWNRPFSERDIDETLLALLQEARALKSVVTIMSAFPKQDRYLSRDASLLIH